MEVNKSKESFQKLNDDEKNDLVGQEVELVQTEIDQVRSVLHTSLANKYLLMAQDITT